MNILLQWPMQIFFIRKSFVYSNIFGMFVWTKNFVTNDLWCRYWTCYIIHFYTISAKFEAQQLLAKVQDNVILQTAWRYFCWLKCAIWFCCSIRRIQYIRTKRLWWLNLIYSGFILWIRVFFVQQTCHGFSYHWIKLQQVFQRIHRR